MGGDASVAVWMACIKVAFLLDTCWRSLDELYGCPPDELYVSCGFEGCVYCCQKHSKGPDLKGCGWLQFLEKVLFWWFRILVDVLV